MLKNNKKLALKLSVFLFVIMGINMMSFGLIMGNRGDCAFGGGGEKGGSIKSYIIEGAGYFLNSYSDSLLFLNKIEMSETNGVDYNEIRGILYSAIENMENAKDAYSNLKQAADNTPYNQAMIDQLLSFDYTGFQSEKGMNESIFKTVESYLSKGDVRGFFTLLLSNSEQILTRLYTIKESVDTDTFPGLSNLWRVNQVFSETLFFGQYGSEVFFEIIGKTKNVCD